MTAASKLHQKAPKSLLNSRPKGSKLLLVELLPLTATGGEGGAADVFENVSAEVPNKECENDGSEYKYNSIQTWGIPWTPLEFVEQAAKAKHPMQLNQCLASRLSDLIRFFFQTEHCSTEHCLQDIKCWLDRAKQLSAEEAEFLSKLHADVEAVISGKRLLIWKDLMQSISYEDSSVFDEFVQGSMLVGQCEASGLWPVTFNPATMTLTELACNAENRSVR